jgi:predicted RNase H-like HicB family nuclease
MKYLIILEPTETGYSAYAPDIEGCVAAGDDRAETIALMHEALAFHLEGMATAGYAIPTSRNEAVYIEIAEPGAGADRPSN